MAITPVDIRDSVSFQALWDNHVQSVSASLGSQFIGADGATWSGTSGMQSCTIRMSYALYMANVQLPIVPNSWKLKGTGVYLPSLASDYPKLPILANPVLLPRKRDERVASMTYRRGIVYMGPFAHASGHLSLWGGSGFHWPHDDYLGEVEKVYFWQIDGL